jgi:peptidoglycan hydrolase-like protein with peptidoglycan-binding domain
MATVSFEAQYICWVQRALIRNGWPGLRVNGVASAPYRDAVRRFQAENGLTSRGDVDSATQDRLIKLNHVDVDYTAWVQNALIKAGVFTAAEKSKQPIMARSNLPTRQAIRRFQRKPGSGLAGDGWVGVKTELALMKFSTAAPPDDTGKPAPCMHGHVDPKPDPDPPPPFDPDPPILKRTGCQKAHPTGYRDIEPHRASAARKARRALLRFKKLSALAEPERAIAWNSGPERRWFGAYRSGNQAKFEFVATVIERIDAILSRRAALKIRCLATPNWIDVDRRSTNTSVGDPARFVMQRPPHAVGLGSAWFGPPSRTAVPPWEDQRIGTFVEAAAHYAGANANIGRKAAAGHVRLANVRPRLARVTAKNYALYVLDKSAGAAKNMRPCKKEHRGEIDGAIADSRRACRAVRMRLRKLASMTPQGRAKAWNAGPERTWFGPYERGSRTTGFAFVAGVSEGICSRLLAPSFSVACCYRNSVRSRGVADCTEQACSGESTLFGFAENPTAAKAIYLANAWFCKPSGLSTADWQLIRGTTLIHETAHIAGAMREVYRPGPARRLAKRNARGARKNAQSYGYYFLAVASKRGVR